MDLELYYKKVEDVLNQFPVECQRNYYANKKDLKVIFKDEDTLSICGSYNNFKNIIIVYRIDSIFHELFHMAFRDKNKVRQKKWKDLEVYYDNGVSYRGYHRDIWIEYGIGLTEGFTEYLARKCGDLKGHSFNYYFVDLLISIYGEDLLKYPLQNDADGLFNDERFFDIFKFSETLDQLEKTLTNMKRILELNNKIGENNRKEIVKLCSDVNEIYKLSIIKLFNLGIKEYKNCDKPLITKSELINKLEYFLENREYQIAFRLDNNKYSVRKKLISLINNLKKYNKKQEKLKKLLRIKNNI